MICKKHKMNYLRFNVGKDVYMLCPKCEQSKFEHLRKLKDGPVEDAQFSYTKMPSNVETLKGSYSYQ